MSKPSDIPDDVWETALTMPLGDTGDMETDITIPIARAIMAERERCAKIVETFVTRGDDDPRVQVTAAIRGEA